MAAAPTAVWLGHRMWGEGQLLGRRNRPEVEAERWSPTWGECFRWPWLVGRTICALPPPFSSTLGSALLSFTPSAKWTSRPPGQLKGASVGSLKHLAVFWRALISLEGLVFQTKRKHFLVTGSALTPGSRSVGAGEKWSVIREARCGFGASDDKPGFR